ncbi:hypothetical protein [Salinarimonas soli]|nr:hypothetical protein [Salinarimonas soli]
MVLEPYGGRRGMAHAQVRLTSSAIRPKAKVLPHSDIINPTAEFGPST